MQAAYSAGMLLGSLVFGATSDFLGRRFCVYLCAVFLVRWKKQTNKEGADLRGILGGGGGGGAAPWNPKAETVNVLNLQI